MNETGFRNWLENVDMRDAAQTSDNLSRCKRVENSLSQYYQTNIALDSEYSKDKLESVIDFLNINNTGIQFNTINLPNKKDGLSSLKTAVKKYRTYKQSER